MIHKTYTWHHSKGYSLFAQTWERSDTPHALIGIVHGQSDHGGRFAHVADFFTLQHCGVMAVDLPGHGNSGGRRGHIDTFHDYLEAVHLMVKEMELWYPGKPMFLYGHSLGGNIVLNYVLHHNKKISGLIVTSPWLRLAFEPPKWKTKLGKIVRRIYPGLQQSTGLNATLISKVNAVVEAYKNDALVHGKISSSAFFEIVEKGQYILDHANELQLPIFLAHGNGDAITDHNASSELAGKRKDIITYMEFEGLFHEMHNEHEQNDLFIAIHDWLILQTQNI